MRQQSSAVLFILLLFCATWKFSDGTCTLPSGFTGNWWDSRTNAVITLSSLQVTNGWEETLLTEQFSTFTCIYSNDTHWVFRSDDIANNVHGNDYYATVCLEYTKVTDNSYYYYVNSPIESLLNKRIFLVNPTTDATYTSISNYCITTSGPDAREYDVLVRQNTQTLVHVGQYLPNMLLGVFDYTVTDSSSTTCSAASVWDGCYVGDNLDRTTITLNTTLCGTNVMGSTNGLFYKVADVFYSDTYYVTLINSAGTDTLFSCIAVTQSGTARSVSTNPGGCAAGQVSTSRTSDSNSQLIALTEYETCLFTTTTQPTTATAAAAANSSNTDSSTNDSSSGTTAAIVGVVLSLFLLIAIIVIAYLLYKNYLQPRKSQITHRTSLKHPADVKQPLPPNSDFTLSDNPKPEKHHVESDIVVEPLTPTGHVGNPFNDALEGGLTPMPELQRAPTSFKWMKRIPEKDGPHGLTPLGIKPIITTNSAWAAPKPLPSIHRQ